MNITKLTPDLAVTGQIGPRHIDALADAGFRTIICNRPDGEEAGQPDEAAVRAAAEAKGLRFAYLPVSHDQLTPARAAEFSRLVAELPKPVVAYCRSGARSSTLWQIAKGAA